MLRLYGPGGLAPGIQPPPGVANIEELSPLTREKMLSDIVRKVVLRRKSRYYPAHKGVLEVLTDAAMDLGFAAQRPKTSDDLCEALHIKPHHPAIISMCSRDEVYGLLDRTLLAETLLTLASLPE